jgi:cytochrome c-type biogenesis protein CcmH/NrfG
MAKTVGVLSGLFTAALAASFVVFLLDALQLKTIVSTQLEAQFKASAARVAVVTVLFVVAFLVLALAGFKTPRSSAYRSSGSSARRTRPEPDAPEADEESPGLIVGR